MPIKNREQLTERMRRIHFECHYLCNEVLGEYLQVAGNIGVFTHSKQEYKRLTGVVDNLTEKSQEPDRKYFKLHKPFVVEQKSDIPKVEYGYLYIRKSKDHLSEYIGDVDFIAEPDRYEKLKKSLKSSNGISGVEIYDRPGWDMIKLSLPEKDSVAFIGTEEMTKKVRFEFRE